MTTSEKTESASTSAGSLALEAKENRTDPKVYPCNEHELKVLAHYWAEESVKGEDFHEWSTTPIKSLFECDAYARGRLSALGAHLGEDYVGNLHDVVTSCLLSNDTASLRVNWMLWEYSLSLAHDHGWLAAAGFAGFSAFDKTGRQQLDEDEAAALVDGLEIGMKGVVSGTIPRPDKNCLYVNLDYLKEREDEVRDLIEFCRGGAFSVRGREWPDSEEFLCG